MPALLTEKEFLSALPKKMRKSVTPTVLDGVNKLIQEPSLRENFRDNLVSYTSVMNDGRFKISSYISAVKYVSHKLLGATNVKAYSHTFPDRYKRLVDSGASSKTINSYCTAYNKTQLVNKILEQTMVPVHILNADLHQKAINVQAGLMVSANSEKVRCDAANSLLTHLKPPETVKMELDVNIKQDKSIDDLRASTLELANLQQAQIKQGVLTADGAARSKLVLTEDDLEESVIDEQ